MTSYLILAGSIFAAIGLSAYLRTPLWLATMVTAGVVIMWMGLSSPSIVALIVVWAVFLLIATPLNIPLIRRRWFSDHFIPMLRKAMPAMSQTEREALEAGTVWWDGELFSGKPNWKKLMATPEPQLTAAEQEFLDGPVEQLCAMLDDWHITEERHDLPPEVWQFIKDKGFFGMIIPKKYGGLEFSALAHSAVVTKVASRSVTAAVTVMVPNSLGPAELLLRYGTEQQREYYLPRLARGEEVPCFALTGPEAGSDASSIPDKGVVCRGRYQGRDIIGIRLNWEKRYITLGPVATVLGLAFKLYDPEHILGDEEALGITLALIPTDTPGIEIGHRHAPLNIAFQNGPNRGTEVFIPVEWIIGGAACAGQGWPMLMESLAAGRSISLPSLSTGAGKLVCRATGAYARIRKQFKTPIGRFEGVEEALARMAGLTYMMDAVRVMTAGAVDQGERPSVISAIAKYHLTESMRQVVNDAMDVQGGSAICMGPRNLLGRVYQAIPISITVEGANILTRSMIIFGQGAIRCHPFVLKEIRALAEPDEQLASQQFDRALFGHVGFLFSNGVRALMLALTGARLSRAPVDGPVRHYYQQINRMCAAFALVSDVAMLTLGGTLKRKEKLSGRLGDILSHLYLASAALKRYQDQGQPAGDLPLVKWVCDHALYHIQQSLDGLLNNFPMRLVALMLRMVVFPLGKNYDLPSDIQGYRLASLLLAPSRDRDRLTHGIYTNRDTRDTIGRLEDALDKAVAAEPAERKLYDALRSGALKAADEVLLIQNAMEQQVISEQEAAILQAAAAARREVIMVDDFPPSYWSRESTLWRKEPQPKPEKAKPKPVDQST